jgi:uncharacterized protein
MGQVVAVLGATPDESKYANRAVKLLLSKGHTVIPVNPAYTVLEGLTCHRSLSEIRTAVDTITVYVNSQTALVLSDEILSAKPKRVILNPGTEHPLLVQKLENAGITVTEGCTLVMLKTGQF